MNNEGCVLVVWREFFFLDKCKFSGTQDHAQIVSGTGATIFLEPLDRQKNKTFDGGDNFSVQSNCSHELWLRQYPKLVEQGHVVIVIFHLSRNIHFSPNDEDNLFIYQNDYNLECKLQCQL